MEKSLVVSPGKNGDLCYIAANVKLFLMVNLKQNDKPNESMDFGKMIFGVIYSECQLILLHMIRYVDKESRKALSIWQVQRVNREGKENKIGKIGK